MTEYVSLPRYKYTALGENQIRLLYLMRGDYDDSLQYTLKTVPRVNTTSYEALSYCWGEGPRNKELICNDAILGISENLRRALKCLRYPVSKNLPRILNSLHDPDQTRILWVDQICINQGRKDEDENSENNEKSKKEKSSQVPLMGQIYSRVIRVLVWLGKTD
jgi:hypothetical protein